MKNLTIGKFISIFNFLIFLLSNTYLNQESIKSNTILLTSNEDSIIYLKNAFKEKFKIGSMINFFEIEKAEEFIINHFDIIAPFYELKPEIILDRENSIIKGDNINPQVKFSEVTKKFLLFCENNQIPIKGSTFVWSSMTPDWFFKENFDSTNKYVSKDIMDERLENFIKNTFSIFEKEFPKLKIYEYDVATEIFENDGGGMRKESIWFRIYGDDSFVIKAFSFARKYAPLGCKLILSDYNEYIPYKTKDIYDMAMKLKELGVIDGIGMESHLTDNFPKFEDYKIAFEKFVSTGLEIYITELEIMSNNNDNNDNQCSFYRQIFQLAIEYKDYIGSIILFGTIDGNRSKQSNSLLFDYFYRPKRAYFCVIEAIEN